MKNGNKLATMKDKFSADIKQISDHLQSFESSSSSNTGEDNSQPHQLFNQKEFSVVKPINLKKQKHQVKEADKSSAVVVHSNRYKEKSSGKTKTNYKENYD